VYIDRREEAIKLLDGLRQSNPSDANVLVALANIHSTNGDKPRALEMIDAALKLHPESAQLKLRRAEIAGADVTELRAELIAAMPESLEKTVLQYELAVQEDRPEDAKQFLTSAIAQNPNH